MSDLFNEQKVWVQKSIKSKGTFQVDFMDIIPGTSETNFPNNILIVDACPKLPKLYGMDKITTKELIDELYMFQSRSGKIYKFGWWDLEIISSDAGTQFTSTEFKEKCQTCGVYLTLAAPDHQEKKKEVKFTWETLHTIAHSLMVHVRVWEAYINFALMYRTNHIFRYYQPET